MGASHGRSARRRDPGATPASEDRLVLELLADGRRSLDEFGAHHVTLQRLHSQGLVECREGRRGGRFTISQAGLSFLRGRAA